MDMHTPDRQDDLSDVERRLSGWRPDASGLDADTMLFAAGLAAGRRRGGLFVVSTLCGLLVITTAALTAWALHEHTERELLAQLLHEQSQRRSVPPSLSAPVPPESTITPAASGYLTLRRQMERDPNRWLAVQPSNGAPPLESPPQPDVFRVGQTDRVLAQ